MAVLAEMNVILRIIIKMMTIGNLFIHPAKTIENPWEPYEGFQAMIGENLQLVTNESVQFEK